MRDRFTVSPDIAQIDENTDEIYDNFSAYPSDLPLDFHQHPAAALEGFRSSEDNSELEYIENLLNDAKGG